jgi:spore coat polysaccharide biosynthesis protein SpsF
MKVSAIIQARMGSSRLPGKSLMDICGQPLLGHIVDRVAACKKVDSIVVATTSGPEDDVLADLARTKRTNLYRGSADDVLDRYYQAALRERCDVVVRITADDPFKDPSIVDLVIGTLIADSATDYASNTLTLTYPEGLDVEVFRQSALACAWREAKLKSEHEHVTPFIWKQPERFKIVRVTQPVDQSHLRWTLDYPEDLEFTRAVYQRLYRGTIFSTQQILDLLEREPALSAINRGFTRNAGYIKTVQEETQAAAR